MDNKLVMISIAAVIGIIVLGSVLMPILDDSTATTDTFTNEGYYTMDKVTSDTSLVITWSKADPEKLTIGGVEMDLSKFIQIGRSYTILGSDTFAVRYDKVASTTYFVQGYGSDYFNAGPGNVTITISGGSVVCHSDRTDIEGGVTITYSIGTDCYVINPNGTGDHAYVMKKSDVAAYLNEDSDIRFIGVTDVGASKLVAIYGTGSLEDGMTLSTLYKSNTITAVTYSDPEPTYTEKSDHKDLYLLDKYTFTIDCDGVDTDATYSYFIVPAEITAERSVHFTAGQNAIFAAIPVLIILAVLLGVVALVIRSRMD